MHGFIPLTALCVCSFTCHQPKDTQLTHASCVHLLPKPAAQTWIGNKNIGNKHTCQIKGFAWRCTSNRNILIFLFQPCKNLMFSLEHKVLVDLIADYRHSVFHTKISHTDQFVFRPYPAYRVMGIAQKEKLYLFICDLFLKILKIHMIAVIFSKVQIIADYLSVIIRDHFRKWIINRRLDQYTIPRLCIGLYCHGKSKHHAWRLYKPLFPGIPSMTFPDPVMYCFKIRCFHFTVSKDSLFCTFYQRVFNVRGSLKIHICHPKWQYICRFSSFYCKIIFQTSGIFSVNHFIKIKISFRHIILPLFLQILFQIHQEDPVHPQFQQKGEGLPL